MADVDVDLREKQLKLLTEQLSKFRFDNLFTDIILICKDKSFPANKIVLAASSDFFREKFASRSLTDGDKIDLSELAAPEALDVLLEFAYTGRLKIPDEDEKFKHDLFKTASDLKFDLVADYCCRMTAGATNEKNFLQQWEMAEKFNSEELKLQVSKTIAQQIELIAKMEDFKKIPIECLKLTLTQKEIQDKNQDEVIKSVLEWLQEDKTRAALANELVGLIHWEKLSKECLIKLLSNPLVISQPLFLTEIAKESVNRVPDPSKPIDSSPVVTSNAGQSVQNPDAHFSASSNNSPVQVNGVPDSSTKNDATFIQHSVAPIKKPLFLKGNLIVPKFELPNTQRTTPTGLNDVVYMIDARNDNRIRKLNGEITPTSIKQPNLQTSMIHSNCTVVTLKLVDETNVIHIYDTKNQKSTTHKIPNTIDVLAQSAVCNDDTKLYFIGGRDDAWEVQSTVYIYDIFKNEWTKGNDIPVERYAAAAASLNGKIYVVGGVERKNVRLNHVASYDPLTNSWEELKEMQMCRQGASVSSVNGKLFVLGGYAVAPDQWRQREIHIEEVASLEVYDPLLNTWEMYSTRLPLGREIREKNFITTSWKNKLFAIKVQGPDGNATLHQLRMELNSWDDFPISNDKNNVWSRMAALSDYEICLVDIYGSVFTFANYDLKTINKIEGPRISYSFIITSP